MSFLCLTAAIHVDQQTATKIWLDSRVSSVRVVSGSIAKRRQNCGFTRPILSSKRGSYWTSLFVEQHVCYWNRIRCLFWLLYKKTRWGPFVWCLKPTWSCGGLHDRHVSHIWDFNFWISKVVRVISPANIHTIFSLQSIPLLFPWRFFRLMAGFVLRESLCRESSRKLRFLALTETMLEPVFKGKKCSW